MCAVEYDSGHGNDIWGMPGFLLQSTGSRMVYIYLNLSISIYPETLFFGGGVRTNIDTNLTAIH